MPMCDVSAPVPHYLPRRVNPLRIVIPDGSHPRGSDDHVIVRSMIRMQDIWPTSGFPSLSTNQNASIPAKAGSFYTAL